MAPTDGQYTDSTLGWRCVERDDWQTGTNPSGQYRQPAEGQHGNAIVPRPMPPVDLTTQVISGPPRPRPRRGLVIGLVALVVLLVLVIGLLAGLLLFRPAAAPSVATTPSAVPSPLPTTSAASVTPTPSGSASTSANSSTTTVAVPSTPVVQAMQVRVTPQGQDLDALSGDADQNQDVYYSASSNQFNFERSTAAWTSATAPSAEDCVRQIQLQPLSNSERSNLSNNPLIKVCTYTSHGNLAFVQGVAPAAGDGAEVAVTLWKLG